MEACFGCGIRTNGEHPMVAVMKYDENEPAKIDNDPAKLWMAVPVCGDCHKDPKHRTRVIKGTYFVRADKQVALRLADIQNIRAGTVPKGQ